jgi:cytidine deaminase
MHTTELYEAAKKAQEKSFSPYSKFRVGAALLTSSGKVFTGCNIENSSFSLTVCAERTALFKAISEGEHTFIKMVIVSDAEDFIAPCGACRQVISDLAGNIDIVMTNAQGESKTVQLNDLLPYAFGKSYLPINR